MGRPFSVQRQTNETGASLDDDPRQVGEEVLRDQYGAMGGPQLSMVC